MHEYESTNSEERPREQDETETPAVAADSRGAGETPAAGPLGPGRDLGVRLVAYAAAATLALGAGFGLTRLIAPPRVAAPSAVIPSPARSGGVFVEDDDETGADSEANIFQATVPGLVHIISDGQPVGIGLVLTPSGKVLTTYQPSAVAAGLTAKYLVSGTTFQATVLGTDPGAGLALLQMQGGDGRSFSTVEVGNSDALAEDAHAVKQLSYHLPGKVMDTAVGTTGTQDAVVINTGLLVAPNRTVTVAGKTLTGLMQSRLQSASPGEIGGPLVNLSGQVIGITVAGDGTGLKVNGYAMPINQALAITRQMDARARPAS